MFAISDIAINRFMSNSGAVCEICCAMSGHL